MQSITASIRLFKEEPNVMSTNPTEMYISTVQASKLLGVTVRTVQNWVENGTLTAKRTSGGHRRIPRSDVDNLLREKSLKTAYLAGSSVDFHKRNVLSVLAVDDDPTMQKIYEFKLGQFAVPNKLFQATNGLEGLLMLGLHKPDVLLLDLEMPGMNGFDLMRTMEKMAEFSSVKVIVVSSMSAAEIIERGGLSPRVSFVPKPVSFDAIETLFAQRATELEIAISPRR